jgi:hypothetical protein
VVPSLLTVTDNEVGDGATQVQKNVEKTPFNVRGSTQDSDTSPIIGQHVAVVIVFTPLVSWHAV